MDFIQLHVTCPSDLTEILIAELAELGFDSFEENPSDFFAYIAEDQVDYEACKRLMESYAALAQGPLFYSIRKIARENWNETWEKNFSPIVVDNQVLIRAPFHSSDSSFPLELVIQPKMSFGTGHHATTSQMISFLLKYPPLGQSVIDAGSGTAILAIAAEKLGASQVWGFDLDDWCIENGHENVDLNACQAIEIAKADTILAYTGKGVDLILANINKNVLLAEMEGYAAKLKPEGQLFISGFYVEDIADLNAKALSCGFQLSDQSHKNEWACLVYRKSNI